jgi:NAD-dependent deacetylase
MDDLATELERAAEALRKADRVAILSGAGASAESGVPTFRASDGLWEDHRIEDVATPMGFQRDPELVWRFYNMRRAAVAKVHPNPGHVALAELEKRMPGRFALITQNIDGLHQRAGSKNVLELHGNLARTRCSGCGVTEDRGTEPLGDLPACPHCGTLLRPDVVWFHEPLPQDIWRKAERAASECDVLIVVGTSAVVYPAASIIPIAQAGNNAVVVECNLTQTDASGHADIGLYGPSGETLPRLIRMLN